MAVDTRPRGLFLRCHGYAAIVNSINVGDHEIELSNTDKSFFEDIDATKGDVIDHYERIAPYALRHVAGRMLVMQRFPDGVQRSGFYQKNAGAHFPDWIRTVTLPTEEGGETSYVVAEDPETFVYLANQGAVVFHTLLSSTDSPGVPDEVIFDLDPPTVDVELVRRVARLLRDVLDDLGLQPRVKSSGQKGLHIHVWTGGDVSFDDARGFARAVARQVVERAPDDATIEHRKRNRGGRVFIDVLRNAPAAHAAMPYTLRATPDAACAVPLDWDEALSSSFHPRRITLRNARRRLGQRVDPWSETPAPSATVADAVRELDLTPT